MMVMIHLDDEEDILVLAVLLLGKKFNHIEVILQVLWVTDGDDTS